MTKILKKERQARKWTEEEMEKLIDLLTKIHAYGT